MYVLHAPQRVYMLTHDERRTTRREDQQPTTELQTAGRVCVVCTHARNGFYAFFYFFCGKKIFDVVGCR